MSGERRTAYILLFLLAVIWGSSFILMKRGLEVYTPYQIGAIRMLTAVLSLLPFIYNKIRTIEKAKWKWLILAGYMGSGIPSILFPLAETHISSALAGMINSLTPVFTFTLGLMFFNMKGDRQKFAGLVIGLIGAILFILGGSGGIGDVSPYALLVVLATVCYGLSVNTIRTHLLSIDPITNTGMTLLFVGIPMGIYLFSTDFVVRTQNTEGSAFSLMCIVVLAIFGTTISTVLFNRLIRVGGALVASSVTYLIPIVALIWGLFDGEKPEVLHYVGFVVIIAGVYLINQRRKN
ncbi:MAG: DMT family transporter [Bacteroidetes bacterium]|nr:DMT family transporter [Bacteroidota bacterium]